MFTEIKSLNPSKAIPKESLPMEVLQEYIHIFSYILFLNFNNNIATGQFPHKLKLADVSPVFKNGCTTDI